MFLNIELRLNTHISKNLRIDHNGAVVDNV